jgi:penicillin-binding protein 2
LIPQTGEVLAMVSKPSFDPNLFVTGISFKEYAALRDSIDRPLFNRVLRGLYAPGSTIKPEVAIAGLDAAWSLPRPGVRPRLLPTARLRPQIPQLEPQR